MDVKMWTTTAVGILGLLSVTSFSTGENELPLVLFTDPPEPPYVAASWIRLACQVESEDNQTSFSYQWTGSCSGTGQTEIVIDDPLMDGVGYAVVWVQSTPIQCLDYWECSAVDETGNSSGRAGRLIADVTGIGLSLPNSILEDVVNNSAVIASASGHLDVFCHSSSREPVQSGHWHAPDGTRLHNMLTSVGSLVYSYVTLSLDDITNEGVYTCVNTDEYGEDESLNIGIYTSSNPRTLSMVTTVCNSDDSLLVFNCITNGLPATAALWSKDGVLINLNGSDFNDFYIMDQILIDAHTAHYNNMLEIYVDSELNETHGVYACDVYSDWMTADISESGRENVRAQFAVYSVGETAQFFCMFPWDVEVEWLYSGEVLGGNMSNSTWLDLEIDDTMHNQIYTCQGRHPDGDLSLHTRMIVLVPDDAISVYLEVENVSTHESAVQPFSVTCCASIEVEGLSSTPVIHWVMANGSTIPLNSSDIVTVMDGETTCSRLRLSESFDHEGEYVCRAELSSPALEQPLVKTVTFALAVAISGSREPSTPQPSPPAAGVNDNGTNAKDIDNEHSKSSLSVVISTPLAAALVLFLLVVAGSVVFVCFKRRRYWAKHESNLSGQCSASDIQLVPQSQ